MEATTEFAYLAWFERRAFMDGRHRFNGHRTQVRRAGGD